MTFQAPTAEYSKTGVEIARDFRENLIIDRYDPVFADMRGSKIKHLRSANSEDAVSWNVFRSLRQIAPTYWMPSLWQRAFPSDPDTPLDSPTVELWVSVSPPRGLLEHGDEGASEIDIVIEGASWVWFLEAKYRSDISSGTTTRPGRDQLLRNIDVGTFYAGVRSFYFSLLVVSEDRSPIGAAKVKEYADFDSVRDRLSMHRPDRLGNLRGVGLLTWTDLACVLRGASTLAARSDEKAFASRAADWLASKGIVCHGA